MRKQISIAFQSDKSVAQYIALAKLVDQYNFDVISVYCDAPYHPSYGPLLLMAPHIHRAQLGPAAVSPFRIHPIDIAASTALLSGLAPGRVYLGLVRGAWLADYAIIEPEKPLLAIREAVEVIRKLLSGRTAGYQGSVYQIAAYVRAPYPLPDDSIPLMIGTWGQKLAGIAGEIADQVKVGGSSNPGLVPVIRSWVSRGESRAGRAPGSVKLVMGSVTVVDQDRELARRLAREKVALYLPVVAHLDPTLEVEPELLDRIEVAGQRGEWTSAGRMISDDLLDRFSMAGNASDIIQQVEKLYDSGLDRVEFGTPHGLDQAAGIRMLGGQVVPVFR